MLYILHSNVVMRRNQIAPEMKKDLTNVDNELAHCESQLSVIRTVGNLILVDAQPVITDDGGSEEMPSKMVASGEAAEVTSSQPLLAEYKEVITCLEKSNMELSTINEQLTVEVVNLENEKTSLIEELQRLQVELQELRGGAMSAAGEDLQIQDGAGEIVNMNKDTDEEEQRGEESDEETEGEQETGVTSVQLLGESMTDKEQVQSGVDVIVSDVIFTDNTYHYCYCYYKAYIDWCSKC